MSDALLNVAAAQGRSEYGLLLALAFGISRGLEFPLIGRSLAC